VESPDGNLRPPGKLTVCRILFGGRRRLFWFFWGVLAITLAVIYVVFMLYYPAPNLPRADKRLLEWGWDTPRLQNMPQYLEAAQNLPFDGLILDIATPNDERGLAWTIFSSQRVDSALLDSVTGELTGAQWGRLTDNFLRVNVSPATIGWYDDFTPTLDNLEAVARLAHELGFTGIMLDTEQYGRVRPFDFASQTDVDSFSFQDYAQLIVYKRGQEVMAALNRGYPGLTVLYTYGLTIVSQPGAQHDLSQNRYGLIVPFIEGMIAAADDGTILVDAFEGSYTYRNDLQFAEAYKLIRGLTRDTFVRDPARYGEFVRAGFGLWLDHNQCGEPGLQPSCGAGFSPDSFQQAVNLALRYADRYVWIYSQGVNWYTGEGIPPDWQQTLMNIGK
jgi:hypothetical protein